MLPTSFKRSATDALTRIATIADRTVACVVARPRTDVVSAEVVADICRIWTALRRVLLPSAATLLVFEDEPGRPARVASLRWRTAFALQWQGWTLRNVLVGPAATGDPACAFGFSFVSQLDYSFDLFGLRSKYGKNPGDVVLPGVDTIVDRFVMAARAEDGRLLELFA